MAPIRVALIGLSASAKTSWAASAHLPYLLSPRGRSHYEIVALLNSSVAAAESAREKFSLPPSVKAYGDPAAVAADPNIDLLVCNTRVDVHFPTVEPSVKVGKAVFVEWPLAHSLERAETLAKLQAADNNIVGLQRRTSPLVLKVKEVIDSGRIGRVVSSDVRGYSGGSKVVPRGALPEGLKYFTDRKVGGNTMTIFYGHLMDYVHYVLGDFASVQGRMQIQRPSVRIFADGSEKEVVQTDVPDLLIAHGSLAGSQQVVDGASLSVQLRTGAAFRGEPEFYWAIRGEKGDLLITSPNGPSLAAPITIRLQDFATEEVSEIEWDWPEWRKELPPPAREIGEEYERYARWVENGKPASVAPDQDWPRFSDAVRRHQELETLFQQFDAQK